jgi:ankyrin repeat protein
MAVVAGPGYSPERKRLVELMIERGANVNARDRNGRTALDAARKAGHAEVVELLVAHGATGTAE